MPQRRVLIIVNPTAGRRGSARRRLSRVVAALCRRGCAVVLRHTASAGDAERLARDAEADFDVVVVAGGDGTLNAVVNGLATSRPLALLPFGTANVLAHDIGLPRRADRLAALIADGAAQAVWPGQIGAGRFMAVAGIGFDAVVVGAVDPRLKRRFGRLAVVWVILVCLWRYRPCALTVQVGDAEHRAAGLIAVTGRCYAGRFVIAPHADPAEPVLDLVLFQRSGRLASLRYLAALLLHRLPHCADIVFLRCTSAFVSAATPVPVEADGEPAGFTPIALGLAPEPLYLIRP